jgi:hypothetical protein
MPLACENASAPGRIRTCDTRFRKPLLYPLSYEGWLRRWPSVPMHHTRSGVGHGHHRRPITIARPGLPVQYPRSMSITPTSSSPAM